MPALRAAVFTGELGLASPGCGLIGTELAVHRCACAVAWRASLRDVRSAVILAVLVLILPACIRHEVHMELAPVPERSMRSASAIGGHAVAVSASGAVVHRHSAMPIELPVDQWWRDHRGMIHRDVQVVRTATPWWQRFPCDFVADLQPWQATVTSHITLEPVVVPRIPRFTSASMASAARAAGYAAP